MKIRGAARIAATLGTIVAMVAMGGAFWRW